MSVVDSIHIGKITYAIDHNTELLRSGTLFKKIEIESESEYTFATMSFDGNTLTAQYMSSGNLEIFKLSKGNNGFFNVDFEKYAIRQGTSFEHAIHPSAVSLLGRVSSRFNDLRRVEFEYRSSDRRQVERNKVGRSGEVVLVQFRTVATMAGINSDLFTECVSAFRSYIRNKSNNVLKENEVLKEQKDEKIRAYQKQRQESALELQKRMLGLLSFSGVKIVNLDQPTISIIGVHRYTMQGLNLVAKKLHALDEAKTVVVYHDFENVGHLKEKYKSATDVIEIALKCIDMYSEMIAKKVSTKPLAVKKDSRSAHPSKVDSSSSVTVLMSNLSKCLRMVGMNRDNIKSYQGKGIESLDQNNSNDLVSITELILDYISEHQSRESLYKLSESVGSLGMTLGQDSDDGETITLPAVKVADMLSPIVKNFGKELNKMRESGILFSTARDAQSAGSVVSG